MSRRFRRRLLLPPGWVALGFLLLLGCLTLRAHWRQLRVANVIQLTMPPLKADTSLVAFYKIHSRHNEYNPFTDMNDKQPVTRISHMRHWQSFALDGSKAANRSHLINIESAIRAIQADSNHAGGVRVRFLSGASYASLVAALDIMNVTNHKKYWLDIRRKPTTFYAVTKVKVRDTLPTFSCGTRDYQLHPLRPASSLQNWLATYCLPTWRLPIVFLLMINVLSLYKFRTASRSQLRQLN